MEYVIVNGTKIETEGCETVMDAVKKAGITLPTFCYRPELKPFGACRMCLVEIAGRGMLPACSTPLSAGMDILTDTKKLRNLRRIVVELLLSSHRDDCTLCPKNGKCELLQMARELGVTKLRYKKQPHQEHVDESSLSIFRDTSKCILCGSCVRVCDEIQSVGALDFAGRGAKTTVFAGLTDKLSEAGCVGCGQCVKACPTGALRAKPAVEPAWDELQEGDKLMIAQVAPAVNVALGDSFGLPAGSNVSGKIAAALRRLGFDRVYDTAFAADLTVLEEGQEFLARLRSGERLPQFTSCCPAWVRFAEQYFPQLCDNLSSCRSPQQMLGALAKERLIKETGLSRDKLCLISIMPCTAKKSEAARPELGHDGQPDVDMVLTTRELTDMIKFHGLDLNALEPEEYDAPFGEKTGAGVIFGYSGGVTEAVVRYAASVLGEENLVITEGPSAHGVKTLECEIAGRPVRIGIVSGLRNTRELIERMADGSEHYDLVEVMACPGGCVNGGGQPFAHTMADSTLPRTEGLRRFDCELEKASSEQNAALAQVYKEELSDHETVHRLLHTTYNN